MKTVHIITRLIIGGAQENTVFSCIDQVEEFGDDVTLITGPGLGPEGSLEQRIRESDVNLLVIPELRRNLHPLRDWRSLRVLSRELKRIAPEIVHTHSSKAGILGRAAAHRLGQPVVHTIHGAAFHFGQPWHLHRLYIAAEKWAAKRTDHFITVCDAMTTQYVNAGVADRERFTTIYSGMDVEPFLHPPRSRENVRTEFGFSPTDVVIGKVARLFHLKGHQFLIEAAEKVAEQVPNAKFLLVGDGLLREEYERRIAELKLSDRFRFTGLVEPERIPELMHAMDIVAHTSEWEGLARVLPQAMLAEKPVVSFAIDGAPEVVLPDRTGCLVDRGDVTGLADALVRLCGDAELRAAFGREGRRLNETRFRHEVMTRRIREVYERVLHERRS